VTDDAGLMLAGFLMRGAICVNVCEVSHHNALLPPPLSSIYRHLSLVIHDIYTIHHIANTFLYRINAYIFEFKTFQFFRKITGNFLEKFP